MYPTSDRLQTRLIPSGTTRSRPVWRLNRSLTQIASVLPDAVTSYRLPRSFKWKGQESVLDCTGAGCGPYKNCRSEPGAKDEPNRYFVPDQRKRVRRSILTFRTQDLVSDQAWWRHTHEQGLPSCVTGSLRIRSVHERDSLV